MRRFLLFLFLVVATAMTMSADEITYLTGIKSNGFQAFNTGYIHKANTRVEMDCNVVQDHRCRWEALLGGRLENYTKNAFCFFSRTDGNDVPCFNRSGNEPRGTGFVYGERIKLVCEGRTATWYRYTSPNQAAGSVTTTGTADDGKTPMLFFNLNTSGNEGGVQIDTSPSCMTLYGCKIYEGDVLVCDFIPAEKNGVVGLYDRVRNTFGGSITSTAFLREGDGGVVDADFRELLTNGACDGTYNGWSLSNGGDGWMIDTDEDGSYFWTSSYQVCVLSQTVNLAEKSFTGEAIDAGTVFCKASALMRAKWEKNGIGSNEANVKVEEQDADGNVLNTVTVLDDQGVYTEWTPFEIPAYTLTPGTRKLKYIVRGKDAVFWGGNFGPSFKNLSLQAAVSGSGPAPVFYNISTRVTGDGSVSLSASEAISGAPVSIYVSAGIGKKVESVTVTDADNQNVPVTIVSATQQRGTYSFQMPASDVTVEAVFTDFDISYEMGTIIDFETGDFSQFYFLNDEVRPWIVTNEDASAGTYCIKSGNTGVSSSSSSISAVCDYAEDGYVAFDAKCMGEGANFDRCVFYIDGQEKMAYGAHGNSWDNYYFHVNAGAHTFKWEYTKDTSVDPTGDAFYVDNVVFGYGKYCAAPSKLSVNFGNSSSATITWEGSSDSFNLRYRLVGTETWSYVNGITENTYTIENLSPGSYEVGVQSTCAETTIASTTFEIIDMSSLLMCYGYATYTFDNADWEGHFISFPASDPSRVISSSGIFPNNYAAAYADGYVWFITQSNSDLCRAPLDSQTKMIGDYEVVVPNFVPGNVAISMAYNYNDGLMYVILSNSTTGDMYLSSFCPDKPSVLVSRQLNFSPQTLAIDSDGVAYCIESNTDKLYHINLTDGSSTLDGETGVPANYVQSMAFDLDTNHLYWAQIYSQDSHGFYYVNTNTVVSQNLGQVGAAGAEITGLFMIPSNPPKNHANFETGDFSQINFQNNGTYPWIVTDVDAYTGTYSMKSGNAGVASSSSVISATYNFTKDGYVCFDAKCMGEGTSNPLDKCIFYIDNVEQFTFGALGDAWSTYAYPVAAGSHTFKWEYKKNGSVNPSGDAFYVDNIYFLQGVTAQDAITGVENIGANLDQDERIYNLVGQRLSKKQKGINIIGRQKVLVK